MTKEDFMFNLKRCGYLTHDNKIWYEEKELIKCFEDVGVFEDNAKHIFIEQLKIKDMDRQYDAGVVCKKDGNYIIGYEMKGAEETFSIGQPVYDKDKNIMGWLGIGLFENLNYSAKIRVPCEYWQICLPTKFCEVGKQVYTYWQMTEVEPQESEDKE